MNKELTISTLASMAKEVKKATKVKKGFAVVNSRMEFLTDSGTWSARSTDAMVTFERIANAKATELHAKVTRIEVVA